MMNRISVHALIPTGYGLNCDYETEYALKKAGAAPCRVHINDLIMGDRSLSHNSLDHYHILVLGGGFSWADDHGAGVILASKFRSNLGNQIEKFIADGKLIMGICNGFQAIVNLGLIPGFDCNYRERRVALTYNDSGNFIDTWVRLRINPLSPCVFTKGLSSMELPVRHGEGKFYALDEDLDRLFQGDQVVLQYADDEGELAKGQWPLNPNGSLRDIAGICDPTGRVFGLMPHPEAFNHFTNHPDWTRKRDEQWRENRGTDNEEGDGIRMFRNAVDYIRQAIEGGLIRD